MDLTNIILEMQDRIIKLEKQVADLSRQVEELTRGKAPDVSKEDNNLLQDEEQQTYRYQIRGYRDPFRIRKIGLPAEEFNYSRSAEEQTPEEEQIPAEAPAKGRDKTRYCYNGKTYLKNQLVLAVVSDYVRQHQGITCEGLRRVFEDRLQGSSGVVVDINVAKGYNGYEKRFFADEDEVLHLADGDMLVCSLWGILNIPNFVERARRLGYNIEEIKI